MAVAQRICKFHWQLTLEDGIRTYCKGHILKLCGPTICRGMAAQSRKPKTHEMLLKLMPRVQKLVFPLDLHLDKALQDYTWAPNKFMESKTSKSRFVVCQGAEVIWYAFPPSSKSIGGASAMIKITPREYELKNARYSAQDLIIPLIHSRVSRG